MQAELDTGTTHPEAYVEGTKRLIRWTRGRPQGPIHIEFYPTNRCNIQCRICWQRQDNYDKTYASEMSDERILRLVDEAADLGVSWWTIKGGGEPMGRGKAVMAMVRRIRERGMNGLLQSNGTLFKPEQLDELVALGWQRVVLSLDGPDEATNDEIRSGGFAKATANLRYLFEARERAGMKTPEIEMNTVVTNRIVERLGEVFDTAAGIGVQRLHFSGLIRFTEQCDPFLVNEAAMARLRASVSAAALRAKSLGIATNLTELLDPEVWTSPNDRTFGAESAQRLPLDRALCFKPYTEIVVHPDGKTGPCCMSYDERSDSLKEKSLREVWEQGYFARVREHFEHNRPMSYCAQCPTTLYRDIIYQRRALDAAISPPGVRLRKAVAGGMDSLRRRGLRETMRHGVRWLQRTAELYF